MKYLIAYDIRSPRRLRRIARALEKQGLRIQQSVFLFQGSRAALSTLMDELGAKCDPSEDIIQAWHIGPRSMRAASKRGKARVLTPPAVILQARNAPPLFIEGG